MKISQIFLNVHLNLTIFVGTSAESLNTEVYGIISGVFNKYEDVPKDTCSTLANGFACPFEAGVMATYAYEADVREDYPAVSVLQPLDMFLAYVGSGYFTTF